MNGKQKIKTATIETQTDSNDCNNVIVYPRSKQQREPFDSLMSGSKEIIL